MGGLREYVSTAALHSNAAFGEPLDHSGQRFVLFDEYSTSQRVGRVVIENWDRGLREIGPASKSSVTEMHGTAGYLDSMLQRIALRLGSHATRERGQERGMNVEHTISEMLDGRRGQDQIESGVDDEIDVGFDQRVVDSRELIGAASRCLVGDAAGWYSGL